MELLICGTSAAEGVPALFCDCPTCRTAHARGGKEIRSRSAYQLGDQLRIDWGPDSFWHGQRYGLHYERLTHLLMTHTHDDHWLVAELTNRQPGFSHMPEGSILTIHGNEAVQASLDEALPGKLADYSIRFEQVTPYQSFEIKELGLTVVPVAADHDPNQTCVNYIIGQDGKWFFQGNDTGFPTARTWDFLKDFKFDIALLDSTSGDDAPKRRGHMSAAVVVEAFEKLDAQDSLAPHCRRIANHFSHNGHMNHDQYEAFFGPHGIETAYDGMRVAV